MDPLLQALRKVDQPQHEGAAKKTYTEEVDEDDKLCEI